MIWQRARDILAAAQADYLNEHDHRLVNPFGNAGMPPHHWRLGRFAWHDLRAAADEIAGPYSIVADNAIVTLFGWPVVVDPKAPPEYMGLELDRPTTSTERMQEALG